ncbi:MAG: patatin-like phospholipase family protein [Proteobacteria bacterium]|nr:patatin-like phospholipase family protein [Pseudomonadota bacterium]
MPSSPSPTHDEVVLVLQGGGALGAYQGGVMDALAAHDMPLHGVAGISIGAINAALIAGNPPAQRVARLRAFWDKVSATLPAPAPAFWTPARDLFNEAAAAQALWFGIPGFFRPRVPPAVFQAPGTPGAISHYDTTPLAETLRELVDFDLLNDGPMRLAVGAVDVESGNFKYFDTAHQRIDERHIMASGALPPAFAPVEIDGRYYWDGGIVSNTPLQYVLDQPAQGHRLIFQVDLFPARGKLPRNLDEAAERLKDIRYSSRTRLNTTMELNLYERAQAAQRLREKLPAAMQADPDLAYLISGLPSHAVDVVELIYRTKHDESQAKDYEFSRTSVLERWAAGHADMMKALRHGDWQVHCGKTRADRCGVRTFDFGRG